MAHTIMIMQPEINIWISRLTSVDPNLIEYRFTFADGVVRYLTIDEIINSPFSWIANQVKLTLTEAIDENKLGLYNKQLYIKN